MTTNSTTVTPTRVNKTASQTSLNSDKKIASNTKVGTNQSDLKTTSSRTSLTNSRTSLTNSRIKKDSKK